MNHHRDPLTAQQKRFQMAESFARKSEMDICQVCLFPAPPSNETPCVNCGFPSPDILPTVKVQTDVTE